MSDAVPIPAVRLRKSEVDKRRRRLVASVAKLPEAVAVGDQHLSLEVRRKRFGWLLCDHHGDGRLALHCRAPRGMSRDLARSRSPAFHIPKYVGQHGWIGYWLDLPHVDWHEVRAILADAYMLTAPKALVSKFASDSKSETS